MSLNIYPELPLLNLSWQHFVLVPTGSRNVFPAVCDVPLCIFEVSVMCSLSHLVPRLNPEFCGPSAKPDLCLLPEALCLRQASSLPKHGTRRRSCQAEGQRLRSACVFCVPAGCLPFSQRHGIDSLIRCTRIFISERLASRQVPLSPFHTGLLPSQCSTSHPPAWPPPYTSPGLFAFASRSLGCLRLLWACSHLPELRV